jgi:DNA polymerase III epsilon subunit family exonuclease
MAVKTKEKMQGTIETIGKESNWKISNSELDTLLKFFPEGLIAIDLETTGLSPLVDRIIEIAAIKITPTESKLFETLINPGIKIPEETIVFHQISDEMVKYSPKLIDVLPSFHDFVGNLPIVAHNAKFDLGFVVMAFQKNNLTLSSSDIFCSCKLARYTHKNAANHKLKTLVTELSIPLVNHHQAVDDAFASLKIFIKSLELMDAIDLRPHGHLFNLQDFNKIPQQEFPEHLTSLIGLVSKAAVIEIKYNGGKLKNEFRPVKLTGLINSPEGSVLYARCLLTDIYKTFQLKKISEIRTPNAEQIQTWLKKHEKNNL